MLAKHCPGSLGFVQPKPEIYRCPSCDREVEIRKQALSSAMEGYFGSDTRRIQHAKRTVEYAEMMLAEEPDADPNIVIAAALLHDIGIKNSEEKHKSAETTYQEVEGPPVARALLKKLDYSEPFICEVCDIIGHHHHPRPEETVNFKVLYDADQLVNAEESETKPPWKISPGAGLLTRSGSILAAHAGKVNRQPSPGTLPA